MTYDDVADIKALLKRMVTLVEHMAATLDHIDDTVADIAQPLPPMTMDEFRAELERYAHIVRASPE